MLDNAPIAIFAHQRKHSIDSLIACLQRAPEFYESKVYFFIDGPRSNNEIEKIEDVVSSIKSISHPDLHLIRQNKNIGLRKSIISGINTVFEGSDRVIVLEDDLVVSPLALNYFNKCLNQYDCDLSVGSITSHSFVSTKLNSSNDAFFLPTPHPWGWATWKNRWERVNWCPEISHEILKSKSFKSGINAGGLRDFRQMLELAEDGLINSWFIYFCYHSYLERWSTLYPPIGYSRNSGVSSKSGTHSSRMNPYDLLVKEVSFNEKLCELPSSSFIDNIKLDLSINSIDSRVLRFISQSGAMKRKFKRLLKNDKIG